MSLNQRANTQMTLAKRNAFPRDARIRFVTGPGVHLYLVDDKKIGVSVTGLIESVAGDHFDPDRVIASMKRSRAWPYPKYCDVVDGKPYPWTDERIKTTWNESGRRAEKLGTDLHGKIELCLNLEVVEFGEEGPDDNRLEMSYFDRYWAFMCANGWEAYLTEAIIFDELADVAGSVDLIARNRISGKFAIIDWKRCLTKGSGFNDSFGKHFDEPLSHVPKTKSNKWKLQVNIYREILEEHYGICIDLMCMVVFHSENSEAEVHEYGRTDDARTLLEYRKALL